MALAAILGAVLAGRATAAEQNPAAMKVYALQEYLRGQRWQSTPRPAPTDPYIYPQRSLVQSSPLPYPHSDPDERAFVVAHLPPGANLWVEDVLMISEASGEQYKLRSAALEKGHQYLHHFRVQWFEDDKWVTQVHAAYLKVGDIHCVEIVPNGATAVEREVAANVATLNAGDRKKAEEQKFCAVQDSIRLGAMGAPVKVNVNGKEVFLCCEGCRAAALKDSEKTLKTAQANKDKPLKAAEKK